ncbi:thaumatin-like protein 1 [Amborella trichopoda]|uniref:thaumatin-like protein 1 n=1 Tax=Amborella trichopoda TaxID=13333 RepID=UPI0009C0C559|nr:thaumatin-like protein 1 [Amborella trichopoda]|eukprot:XP_011625840.2 thaumatin-like protein 1 [Amborella trichopoda]
MPKFTKFLYTNISRPFSLLPFLLSLLISFLSDTSHAGSFTVANNCPYAIWPGTLAGAGTPQLPLTGFQLDSGQSVTIPAAPGWSGRIWARTGCEFDVSGIGHCLTGDCGGKLECDGMGAIPPASLFEITLGTPQTLDYYDVSLVDGYNLPMVVVPRGTSGSCNTTGCAVDINVGCPKELQVVDGDEIEMRGGVVGCKSACEAFGSDAYCCSGEYGNPETCRPTMYSNMFKRACPTAYSYAYDDGTSTFTCMAANYVITFCPTNSGLRRSDGLTSNHQPTPNYQTPPPPYTSSSQQDPQGCTTEPQQASDLESLSSSTSHLPFANFSLFLLLIFYF